MHQSDIKSAPAAAGKPSLLAGIAKRFTGKRAEPVRAVERQVIDPSPSIDAADAIEPDVANQLLEPGSGVPDVKKILERVRAGQTGRNAPPSEADKADFIAAARRAAQQAAEEVDSMNRGKGGASASPMGVFSRNRRPILMAVGAVLLAIMSYPLVNTLIRGDQAPPWRRSLRSNSRSPASRAMKRRMKCRLPAKHRLRPMRRPPCRPPTTTSSRSPRCSHSLRTRPPSRRMVLIHK